MAVNAPTNRLFRFGEFQVDVKNRLLLRGSEIISITPKVFDLLLLFVANCGSLLEKKELMERIWGDTFVEEANLARNVSFLRKALGEDPRNPEYIVTVAGHGYRFVAQVEQVSINGNESIEEERTPRQHGVSHSICFCRSFAEAEPK